MRCAATLLVIATSALPLYAADKPAARVVRNIPYINDSSSAHTLDLYLPQGGTSVPVVVSFYGGALTAGDKSQQTFVGDRFSAAGIATVVLNYRLTPEVMHPGHIQDAAASVAWVKRHIGEYGGNADRILIIGHSAGAYLVALLATDERYLAAEHLSLRDIRGVVPVSAFYWVERQGVAPDRDKRVWGTDEKVWIDASPAHHLHNRVPPLLILYADGDEQWRREQNVQAADAIRAAGNVVEIVKIRGRTHNSIWTELSKDGDEVSERIVQFVRRLTGGQDQSR